MYVGGVGPECMEPRFGRGHYKRKHTPCSVTGRVNTVNISIKATAIDRWHEIPISIPMALFKDIEDSPKIHTESQDSKYPKQAGDSRRELESPRSQTSSYITKP